MDHDGAAYVPIDVTKRKVLLKLELSGDIPKKLQAVASTVYGIGLQTAQPAEDNSKWKTTDEVLYSDAKRTYDEILATFRSAPKVFKFESTKKTIWERNTTGGGLDPPVPESVPLIGNGSSSSQTEPGPVSNKEYWKNRRGKKEKAQAEKRPLTAEEVSATYIDPFQTVMLRGPKGEKRERVEVWHEKLEMLKQLTPREDLEGYEIREDYFMQQERLRLQADFQQRMRAEIRRREEFPTEIEQVEDVLYDVVDAISRNLESAERAVRLAEKRKVRSVWHPAAVGFKMKPLGATVSESGVVTIQVSDFLFSDFMISPTGHMLAVRAPPEMFELHEQERRIKLENELRRLEEEELEKKRPLTEKLRIAVAMARHDPAAAAQKAATDVLDRAVRWPRAVSERLMQQSKEAIAQGLAGLMYASADPQAALEDLSESLVKSYRNVLKRTAASLASPEKKRPRSKSSGREPSIKDVEQIINQEEEDARRREELLAALRRTTMGIQGRPMVPVEHADAVQITVTLLCSPPPAYTMRPPPSWRRDLVRAKKRMMAELKLRREQAAAALQRAKESDAAYLLQQLLHGGPAAALAETGPALTEGTVAPSAQPPAAVGGSQGRVPLEGEVAAEATSARPVEDALLPSAVRGASRLAAEGAPPSGDFEADDDEPDSDDDDGEAGEEGADAEAPAAGLAADDGSWGRSDPGLTEADGMHTARSRQSHATGAASGLTGVRTLAMDHPLDQEEVHIERIRNKRSFAGNILPEDMVPKAFKNFLGKLTFDTTERRDFEALLVAELADSLSLPVRNFSIEEIRRLQIDAPHLYDLRERKSALVAMQDQARQDQQERLLAQRDRKKAYNLTKEKEQGLDINSPLLRYDESPPVRPADVSVAPEVPLLALPPVPTGEASGAGSAHSLRSTDDPVPMLALEDATQPSPPESGARIEHTEGAGSVLSAHDTPSLDRALSAEEAVRAVMEGLLQQLESKGLSEPAERTEEDENAASPAVTHSEEPARSPRDMESPIPASADVRGLDTIAKPKAQKSVTFGADVVALIQGPDEESAAGSASEGDLPVTEENSAAPSSSESAPVVLGEPEEETTEEDIAPAADVPAVSEDANDELFVGQRVDPGAERYYEPNLSARSELSQTNSVSLVAAHTGADTSENIGALVRLSSSSSGSVRSEPPQADDEAEDAINAGPRDAAFAMKSQPIFPAPFKIGIPNPDEVRLDPSHWLSKSLGALKAEEKRQFRIQRLRLLRKEDELTKRLRALAQEREELIEDAVDLFAPVAERLQPLVDAMKPVVRKANAQVLEAATRGLRILDELTRDYRGPRMLDMMRFTKLVQQASKSAKLLGSTLSAASRSLKAGQQALRAHADIRAPGRVVAVRHPREVTDTMEDMLEELEYRAVEDEVDLLLGDMCAAVEARTVRQEVRDLLASLCDRVESLEEERRPAPRELVPLEESAPSEYDFATMVKHLNIGADGAIGESKPRVHPAVNRALALDAALAAGSDDGEDEEADAESALLSADAAEASVDEEGEEEEEEEEEEEAEGEEGSEGDGDGVSAVDGGKAGKTKALASDDGSGGEQEDGEDEEEEEGEEEEDDDEEDEEEEDEGEEEEDEEDGSDVEGKLLSLQEKLQDVAAEEGRTLALISEVGKDLLALEDANARDEEPSADQLLRAEVFGVVSDMCDRVEVALLLEEMCAAVELRLDAPFLDLSEIDASGVSAGESTIAAEDLAGRLVGCEVTFMVFVGADQRKLDGLADIEAEDIAVMLQQQLYDREAPLFGGKYTGSIVDMRYKVAHKRRRFEHWESFYAHLVHPSFFGYTVKRPAVRGGREEPDADGLVNGRLPSGVAPLNPTLLFNERNKDTFQELAGKPLLRPPGERVKREDVSDEEDGSVASSLLGGEKSGSKEDKHVLDLNVDEFAHDVKRLKLYRPNMGSLTARDIQRLKRLHKAFEEHYEEEMRKGLVDGTGLRPEQYQALKDRDSAYRIYRTARQKYKHTRKDKGDELVLPPLEVTRIDHETFDGWVEEVRLEDQQRLREARSLAAKRKKILQQEAQLRRGASQKRFWIIDTFVSACESPLDVGHAFEEEMLKVEIQREFVRQKEDDAAQASGDPATEKLLQDLQQKEREFKKTVISEEKKTRKLFEYAVNWAKRRNEDTAPPVARPDSAPATPSTENQMPGATEEAQTDVPAPVAAEAADLAHVSQEEPTTEPDDGERPTTALSRATSKASVPTSAVEEEAPSLEKRSLHEYLAAVTRAIERDRKLELREERRKVREAKALERQRRLESLHAFQSKGSGGGGLSVEVPEEAEEDASSDEDGSLSAPSSPDSRSPMKSASEQRFGEDGFAQAQLSLEEIELAKQIAWIQTVQTYKQFRRCLEELPTLADGAFARDELILFANVLCEVEPLFRKVLAELSAAKEAADVAMGLRKSKSMEAALQAKQHKREREEKKRLRKLAKAGGADDAEGGPPDEEADRLMAEKLLAEQQRALEALARAAEREKAWYMAHPHKFIRHPGEAAFCIVCREKETEYWTKTHREAEQQWREGFDTLLQEAVDGHEQALKEGVEGELKDELMRQAGAAVAEEVAEEERQKAENANPLARMGRSMKNIKLSPLKLFHAATKKGDLGAASAPGGSGNLGDADEDEQAWPRELSRITRVIRGAGLSLVDARGKSILPKRPPKKAAVQMYVAPVLVEAAAEDSAEASEALGLRIRVWHRDAEGGRANFLGLISFSEKEMMKPPKGMRTFPLQRDPAVVETEPTHVSGSIVVMLRASHSEHRNGSNTHWRLEIIRAAGLAPIVDVARKPDSASPPIKPPNCFVEVYWKGPGIKNKEVTGIHEFTLVGHTATKQNTDSPQFEKDTDASMMELPPVWTDRDIPRSQYDGHVQEGGGWVPRNQVPAAAEEEQDGAGSPSSKRPNTSEKRFPFGAKSEEEVRHFRTVIKYNELVNKELQARLEALRYLFNAEERERKCMAQEERQQRSTALAMEVERSQALVKKQTEFSRSFMRLLHLVQSPPNILARLRFLMGEDSRGGGQKVMCEDPATGKVFHVVATPILRKEDEAFMLAQLNALFTTACPNLTRVVDFSVHQLRDFNDKGFSSIDERMAIAVLDYIEGCTVMQFLQKNWDTVTNDTFRDLLCQIMGAIKALHRAGITHRNIHPDAIVLQLPSTRVAIKKRSAATRSSTDRGAQKGGRGASAPAKLLSQLMVCYLGDYWFLHNPRTVGCESSVGRADWGAPMTVPPEAVLKQYPQPGMLRSASSGSARDTTLSRIAMVVARRNGIPADTDALPSAQPDRAAYTDLVTDKSDMYAFGVCLYYWATNGLHKAIPLNSEGFVDLPTVKRNLPLKWKPWLHSLFDMCLQVLPENRAAAKDVHLFLSSRFGK